MTLKEKIENHPYRWWLSGVSAGFMLGLACYQGVLTVSQLKVVRLENYVPLEEYHKLKEANELLKEKAILFSTRISDVSNTDIKGKPIIEDVENSQYENKQDGNANTAIISYRFLNASYDKLNCVVEFTSGYYKDKNNDSYILNDADWIKEDIKTFSFIIEPDSSFKLFGEIAQVPKNVSKHCTMDWKLVSCQKIK